MRSIRYQDFTVLIGSGDNGAYTAQVVNGPYRGSVRTFDLPYGPEELEAVVGGLQYRMRFDHSVPVRHARSPSSLPDDVEPSQVGTEIFRAVFSGSIRDSLLMSLASVESRVDTGLRLRLRFDPDSENLARLGRLPWELLYRKETEDFVGRDVMTPIIRDWSFPRRTLPSPSGDRLRVLVVQSNPPDTVPLDLESERQRILKIWTERHGIEVKVLTQPTLDDLHRALSAQPFQVLHYMGHGYFDLSSNEGVLYFEPPYPDCPRDLSVVPGRVLAEVVKGHRSLRLVFLNACETGRIAAPQESFPHTGVAAALLQAGIPAVIAMQYPISDPIAKDFSDRLYSGLAAGELLETAVTEGRRKIFFDNPESLEWIVPVLYMSLPDGLLFDVTSGRVRSPVGDHLLQPSADNGPRPASLPPSARLDERGPRVLLQKVKRAWIDGVLRRSIHHQTAIELEVEQQLDFVDRPLARILETSGRERKALSPNQELIEIFQQHGTLLILGEPGSGKTTTMLELARDLIKVAEEDPQAPVPVVFNLSTWTRQRRQIDGWLLQELRDKFRIPVKLGRAWLEQHRLLILLDGLDEVRFEERAACVLAINELAKTVGLTGLVVCSRRHEYEVLPELLQFDVAVLLRPLTGDQIEAYLEAGGDELIPLRRALHEDAPLRVLAQTPLMLSIMSLAYRDGELPSQDVESIEGHREHLFDAYIDRMLRRNADRMPVVRRGQTLQWLSWLGRTLDRRNQKIFMVESLQPELLESCWDRLRYLASSRLLPALPVACAWLFPIVAAEEGWVYGAALTLFVLVSSAVSGTVVDLFWFELTSRNQGLARRWERYSLLRLVISVVAFAGLFAVLFSPSLWLAGHVLAPFGFGSFLGLIDTRDFVEQSLAFGSPLSVIYALRGWRRSYADDIRALETIAWSLVRALNAAGTGAVVGGVVGLALAGLDDFILSDFWAFSGFGASLGLLFGGFSGSSIEAKDQPNQGIFLSLKKSTIFGLVSCWIITGALLLMAFDGEWSQDLLVFVLPGVTVGWIVANAYGGLDVAQHYLLRFLLARRGLAPFRYPRFLDLAARSVLLQKVGGGYMFVHRLFQEHFTAMVPERPGRGS